MDRRAFLNRAAGLAALVVAGRHAAPGTAVASTAPATTVEVLAPSSRLVASGGLCAPLTPCYTMPTLRGPLVEVLPRFQATRGMLALEPGEPSD